MELTKHWRWHCLALALAGMCAVDAAAAVEVRQVMKPARYSRGDENVRIVQPADEAAWVWMPGPAVFGQAAACKDSRSWFYRFRNDFTSDGSPLRFDVTADERFVLYLDGQAIARGPQRGTVDHWCYQSYEIAGLAAGAHRLEAVCWQLLAGSPRAQLSYRGGFLLKAEGAYDAALTTGKGPWRVAQLKNTVMTDTGTSRSLFTGFQCRVTGTGFPREEPAADAWTKAAVVRAPIGKEIWWERQPGWMLFPADRPDQMYDVKTPGRVVNCKHDLTKPFTVPANAELDLWWNLDDYYCAYPELETAGGKGAVVTWGWTESLRNGKGEKGNRDEWKGKSFSQAFTDTFVCDGRADAFFTTPWWRCGRWCRLTVKTADAPLTVRRVAIGESRYPLSVDASFRCSDPSVERIWRLSRRTIETCLHEMLFDCPYYEQQMYPGDARIELQILNALTADPRMARFAMSVYDWDRRDNGMVAMNFPSRGLQESSTYTMCWIMMFRDHLMAWGDLSFLKTRMPGVRHSLMGLAAYENADGLLENLPGWSFMDWVDRFSTGVAPCGAPGQGVSALNNLQYLLALESAAAVDEAIGEKEFAAIWRARAKRLGKILLDRFWDDGRGLLADTVAKDRFSEHAQAMGIVSGLLTGARRDSALKALADGTGLAKASSYFAYYVFEALTKGGRAELVLERLGYWNNYLSWGAKTAFETQRQESRSDCHAWSASPIYFLQTAIAGVRPAAPGYARVRVAPQPGRLAWLQAVTPTPKGKVALDLRFHDGGAFGSVVLPPGLEGEFVWKGETRPLKPGMNEFDDPELAKVPCAARPLSYVGMQHVSGLAPDWWEKRHEAKLAELASHGGKVDVVLLGDSITHDWEGARGPGSDYGGKRLAEFRRKYSVVCLGFGGDTTRNLLWRLENGELDGYEAKCFTLLIGTNNPDSPRDIAAGIRAILDTIARKQPQAKTLLIPILPCGETAKDYRRARNAEVRSIIETFADGDRVRLCDFGPQLLNADGSLDKRKMRDDNLHLIGPGYDVWADAVAPHFMEIIGR